MDDYLAEATARGDLKPGFDAAILLEMVIGAALAAILVRGPGGLTEAWVDTISRILLDGVNARR